MTNDELIIKQTKDLYEAVQKLEMIRQLAQELEDLYHKLYKFGHIGTLFEEKSINNAVAIIDLVDGHCIDARL